MKRRNNDIILAFGDTHFPYCHPRTFEFLATVVELYPDIDRVVHMGDLLDQYCFSSYPKAPNHDTPNAEIEAAKRCVKQLAKMFPHMEIMASNHDDRLYKKGTHAGIPKEILLPYEELIGSPRGWRWHKDLTLTVDSTREKVHFRHTTSELTLNAAKSLGCTTVLGHSHNRFGVQAVKGPARMVYGVDTGCLISDKGSPYAYNKGSVTRPIHGCVLIVRGVPFLMPMRSILS